MQCLRRSSALGDSCEVPDVLLVRGVGGGLRIVDRVREGGGEGGLAAVGNDYEGPVLVAIVLRDDADEVGVEAVDEVGL